MVKDDKQKSGQSVEESKIALAAEAADKSLKGEVDCKDSFDDSSFNVYGTIEGSGKFKCRACLLAFKSKKLLEKHRKTAEHKRREKKYSEDHARQMQINKDEDLKFQPSFKMSCPECAHAFKTEEEFRKHARAHHNHVDFDEQDEIVKKRSLIAWKMHFFPLFKVDDLTSCAETCKVKCNVKLRTRDEILIHLNTCHQILQLCTKCNLVLPFDIMKFH